MSTEQIWLKIALFIVWGFWKHHNHYMTLSSINYLHPYAVIILLLPLLLFNQQTTPLWSHFKSIPSCLTDSCSAKLQRSPSTPVHHEIPALLLPVFTLHWGWGFPTLFMASLHFEYEDGSMGPDYQRLKKDSGYSLLQTNTHLTWLSEII